MDDFAIGVLVGALIVAPMAYFAVFTLPDWYNKRQDRFQLTENVYKEAAKKVNKNGDVPPCRRRPDSPHIPS